MSWEPSWEPKVGEKVFVGRVRSVTDAVTLGLDVGRPPEFYIGIVVARTGTDEYRVAELDVASDGSGHTEAAPYRERSRIHPMSADCVDLFDWTVIDAAAATYLASHASQPG